MSFQARRKAPLDKSELGAYSHADMITGNHWPLSKSPHQPINASLCQEKRNKASDDGFLPITRPWGRPDGNSATTTAAKKVDKNSTPMSRWLSQPQREQPWTNIDSVLISSPSRKVPVNATKERSVGEKDSAGATRGSTAGS